MMTMTMIGSNRVSCLRSVRGCTFRPGRARWRAWHLLIEGARAVYETAHLLTLGIQLCRLLNCGD